jgi:hypothetical protein
MMLGDAVLGSELNPVELKAYRVSFDVPSSFI